MSKNDTRFTYAPVNGSERVKLAGYKAVGSPGPRSNMIVLIKVRRKRRLPELAARPRVLLSRNQLGRRYGASARDIAKVISALGQSGLTKVKVNAATRTVRLRGTVSQLETAFRTKLFNYSFRGDIYTGRTGPVYVPREIADIVEGVFGLDNRRVGRRRKRLNLARKSQSRPPGAVTVYTPAALASRYNFPQGDGRGQTIGLLEFGGGYFERDLRKFCRQLHIRMPRVKTISVDGTSTKRRDGDESEVMLDVEVVAGLCPRASILVYFSSWTEQGWISALDSIVHDKRNGPHVISVSWGNAEDANIWTRQAIQQINEDFKEAAYLGITVCAAAGDDGSSDGVNDGFAHVDFPGSSPYVLSVGGTSIPANKGLPDLVWKAGSGLRARNGGSTGGGVSTVMSRPSWQRVRIKSVNPTKFTGRCVPDVAANADWSTSPYGVVVNGKIVANGGTSAASPLWTALIALINSKLPVRSQVGYLTPLLYCKKRRKAIGTVVCSDVISGDNETSRAGGYSARAGYDAVSGWGTPNGEKLLSLFEGM